MLVSKKGSSTSTLILAVQFHTETQSMLTTVLLFKIHTFIVHTRGRSGIEGHCGSSHTVMGQLIKMQGQGVLDIDWLISNCGVIQDSN